MNKRDVNQVASLSLDLYKVHAQFERAYRIKSKTVCLKQIKIGLNKYFKKQKRRTILVCVDKNQVVGFVDFWLEKRECYVLDRAIWIYEIHVKKNYRGMGVASKLFEEILKIAKRKNIKEINMTYLPKNIMSSGFWKSLKAKTLSINACINIKK
jgi:ribosomal protein S18 acetylase RimI-like enzyme